MQTRLQSFQMGIAAVPNAGLIEGTGVRLNTTVCTEVDVLRLINVQHRRYSMYYYVQLHHTRLLLHLYSSLPCCIHLKPTKITTKLVCYLE